MLHRNRSGGRRASVAASFERGITATIGMMSLLLAALTFAGCSIPSQPEDELHAEVLTIEPLVTMVGVGDRLELRAVPRDGNGDAVPGYQITWRSSSEDIATISDAGVLTALSVGTATITAEAEKPSKGANGNGRANAPGILKKSLEITVEEEPGTGIVSALTPVTYEPARLGLGDAYYLDRGYTIASLEPGYDGWLWIRTANDDKTVADDAFISFTLGAPAVVAVGYDRRATELPGWLQGWQRAAWDLETSDGGASPLRVYYRTFGADASVVLGGNMAQGAAGAGSMYVVLVLPEAELRPTAVRVTPSQATLKPGETAQFGAAVVDQLGQSVAGSGSIEWSATGGTIDAQGLFTSGKTEGTYEVTATSGGQSGGAIVTVGDSPPPPPPPPPSGGAFYVDINDPNASDGNPGTEESPWKTIRKAVETLTAGQTAYVKNGTYIEGGHGCTWTTPALNPANSGQAGAPIAFRAYPGHTPIITNNDSDVCPTIGADGRKYIVWDGFELPRRHIAVFNSDHITIENCEVYGIRADGGSNVEGVRVENSSDIMLRNLSLHDIHNAGLSPNGAGVKLYEGTRVTVENSEIYDTETGIYNKRRGVDNVFRYNYIHDTGDCGINLGTHAGAAASGLIAHHNVVYNAGSSGIRVMGSDDSRNDGAQVYSNTIVSSKTGIIAEHTSGGLGGGKADVWNNILVGGGNNANSANPSINNCDHNLFYNTDVGCGISGNPLFEGGSGPQAYRLQLGSPAVGAGRNGASIGAYEAGHEFVGRHSP